MSEAAEWTKISSAFPVSVPLEECTDKRFLEQSQHSTAQPGSTHRHYTDYRLHIHLIYCRMFQIGAGAIRSLYAGVGSKVGAGVGAGVVRQMSIIPSDEGATVRRVLVTGALGQIGSELVELLQAEVGVGNVIVTDVRKAPKELQVEGGVFKYLDVGSLDEMEALVVDHNIDSVVHLAGILSGTAEMNPELGMRVNTHGIENVITLARRHSLRVFAPSSIAAFGPSTIPRENVGRRPVMDPNTNYGISKLYTELLLAWAVDKHGIDARSVRYPGIVSWKTPPGGGTTDWACAAPMAALQGVKYVFPVRADTVMPMLYMDDALQGTIQLLKAPRTTLKDTTYNLGGCSFSPEQLVASIHKFLPDAEFSYEPDYREAIARSWPVSLDSTQAEQDWDWQPKYDLDAIVEDMLANLEKKLKAEGALRSPAN